ncbi:hypothetical protein PTSG_08364 [Salpingoeca rosetta]|uniref:Uncharacterized protein n=1 Tax=Salpingoeca rosetta (strain ATCC 50818 / BSB-021) TaxID=946362 RepID=F2UJH1_SALR5|nr:uncharacterized protein PTSG_08364 [Salpingoeca rosetta]EGD77270.1 hypothetical protein PTSG_08364 [Salpingoeca rosetta]|eukprot:XP_004990614.1 hypothetical protein PTSG_08364 [Salpingoeca rosetta]
MCFASLARVQNNAAAVIAKMESDESAKQETEQLAEWRKQQFPHMPINILRHVIMSGIESTVALLPPAILNGTTFAHDPMPPPDGINEYEQQQQQEEMRQTRRGRHGNGGDGGGDGDALAPWRAFLQSFNPNFNAEATEQDEQRMAEARQQVHVRVREVFDRAREAATSLTRSLTNYMQRQGDDGGNGGGDDDGSGDAGGDVEVDPDYMADLQPEELEELLRDNNNNNNNNSNTGARRGRGRNAGGRGQ